MNQRQKLVSSVVQLDVGVFQVVVQRCRWVGVWSVWWGSLVLPESFSQGPAASHRAAVQRL